MRFRPVTRSKPCKICGKPDWCSLSFNEKVSLCRRVEGGISKVDKSGCDFWLHGLPEKKSIKNRDISIKSEPVVKINPPQVLNEVYNYMLDILPLLEVHRDNLELKRKIPEINVFRNRYRSLIDSYRKYVAEKLLTRFGSEICSRTPGLYQLESGEWSIAGSTGLLIPVRNQYGLIIGLKIRSFSLGKYTWLSSKSKGGCSPGCQVHHPIWDYSNVKELRITEGELKADIATIFTDTPTLSIPGVGTWKKVIPIIQNLKPDLVKIAFDSDYDEKRLVASSLVRMIKYFKKSGVNFKVEVWNK